MHLRVSDDKKGGVGQALLIGEGVGAYVYTCQRLGQWSWGPTRAVSLTILLPLLGLGAASAAGAGASGLAGWLAGRKPGVRHQSAGRGNRNTKTFVG